MADTTSTAPQAVIQAPAAAVPAVALEAMAAAKAYARDALAPETKRAYAADWAHFTAWCEAASCAALAGLYSRSALERRLAAIGHAHRLRGLAWSAGHPLIRTTLRGIHRRHGSSSRQDRPNHELERPLPRATATLHLPSGFAAVILCFVPLFLQWTWRHAQVLSPPNPQPVLSNCRRWSQGFSQ